MLKIFSVLLLLPILSYTLGSSSETLEVIVTNTKLPLSPRAHLTAGYDGDDTNFLWGGDEKDWQNDIMKYYISNQTTEYMGRIPHTRSGSGSWIGNNNFVYIGGYSYSSGTYSSDVWNFETTNPSNWTSVTKLKPGLIESSSIWDEEENTYIIGGKDVVPPYFSGRIFKYSSTTRTVVYAGKLPKPMDTPAVVWDSTSRSAYIFGGKSNDYGIYLKDIVKFDAVDGEVTTLGVALPEKIAFASAIWNGTDAYIIGGTTGTTVTAPPIVRFNPITHEVTSVPVNNFPTQLYMAACVFVKKLNRIYIFGGYNGSKFRDEIMYIGLNETDYPPTTTEAGTTEVPTTQVSSTTASPTTLERQPTTEESTTARRVVFECPTSFGFYADPKNCRGFYECRFWTPYHYCCPLPLFYNPWTERCDFQHMVECHNDPGLPCYSPPPYTTTTPRWPEGTSQSSYTIWYIIIGTAAVIIIALVIYCHIRGKYHHCRKLRNNKVELEVTRPEALQHQRDPIPTAPPQSYFETQNRQLRGPFTPNQNFGSPARRTIFSTDHRPVGSGDFEEPPPPYSSVMKM